MALGRSSPSWRSRASLFSLCVVGLLGVAKSEALCSIFNHRSAIIGKKLYFASGNYTFDEGEPFRSEPDLFSIELRPGLDLSGPIPQSEIERISLPSPDLEATSPTADISSFFYNESHIYAYTASPDEPTSNNVWVFDTNADRDRWSTVTVGGDSSLPGALLNGEAATSKEDGVSYYLGGEVDSEHGNNAIGLTVFNASKEGSPTWDFRAGAQPPAIQFGQMVFVRHGEAGVLIAFGGYNTTSVLKEDEGEDEDEVDLNGMEYRFKNMSRIYVYDIASETWFVQEATAENGNLPVPRSEFCATVSSAPDDSSFNINMYGGLRRNDEYAVGGVWVLSIPSFRWVQTDAEGDPDAAQSGGSSGRARIRCDMLNERQMIVSGGIFLDEGTPWEDEGDFSPAWSNRECNSGIPPIRVFDTSELAWRNEIGEESDYEVPNIVYQQIGGDGSGGATERSPVNGWADARLEDIFSKTVSRNTGSEDDSSDGQDPESGSETPATPKSPKESPTSHAAIIAGATIGGFALLCVIGTALFFWRRNKQRKLLRSTYAESVSDISASESIRRDTSLELLPNPVGVSPFEREMRGISEIFEVGRPADSTTRMLPHQSNDTSPERP